MIAIARVLSFTLCLLALGGCNASGTFRCTGEPVADSAATAGCRELALRLAGPTHKGGTLAAEEVPLREVLPRLLLDTGIEARIHPGVDLEAVTSFEVRAGLAHTLDEVCEEAGCRWHVGSNAIYIDTAEGDSLDALIERRYTLHGDRHAIEYRLGALYAQRRCPGFSATHTESAAGHWVVTVRGFLCDQIPAAAILGECRPSPR